MNVPSTNDRFPTETEVSQTVFHETGSPHLSLRGVCVGGQAERHWQV